MLVNFRGVCFVCKHSSKMTDADVQTKSCQNRGGGHSDTSKIQLLADLVEQIDRLRNKNKVDKYAPDSKKKKEFSSHKLSQRILKMQLY